jgi:protein ImuB
MSLRVELARAREARSTSPLAVVIARPGGAVDKGLDEVSREARALGVRPGDTIAAARARTADLNVRVVALGAVSGALARTAEAILAFGPTTSFELGGASGDVVFVNVTGCAHLFGGEGAMAAAIERRVRQLGHASRVAVADGPRIAAAIARYGRERVSIVEEGR